jgi:hypothetical protein
MLLVFKPDGKFAFLIGYGEDQQTIDLIDKKTEEFELGKQERRNRGIEETGVSR